MGSWRAILANVPLGCPHPLASPVRVEGECAVKNCRGETACRLSLISPSLTHVHVERSRALLCCVMRQRRETQSCSDAQRMWGRPATSHVGRRSCCLRLIPSSQSSHRTKEAQEADARGYGHIRVRSKCNLQNIQKPSSQNLFMPPPPPPPPPPAPDSLQWIQ